MGRIARQDALAYIFQLILRTLPSVKAELKDNGYTKYGREETRRMLSGPSDLDEITDPAQLPTGAATLHAPHSARNGFARSINSAVSTQEWPRSSGSRFARLNSIRPATASWSLVTPPSALTSAIRQLQPLQFHPQQTRAVRP
jgi:hypothetical protein